MRKQVQRRMRAIEASILSSSPDDRFHPLSFCVVLSPHFSLRTAADLFGMKTGSLEDLVGHIFGRPPGQPFGGRSPNVEAIPVRIDGFPASHVSTPIDWSIRLAADRRWRLLFHSLTWLPDLCREDGDELDAAGRAVLEYRDHLVGSLPIDLEWDEFTWGDHPLAIRTKSILTFLQRYTRQPSRANPEVILAALQILLVQLTAILNDTCYTPGHNHGLFQDLALLGAAKDLKTLRHRKAIQSHVVERIVTCQLNRSVTRDGAHKENSPEYHLLFARLLLRALSIPFVAGNPSRELRDGLEAVLWSLVQFIRPDATLAPFGDSGRVNIARDLGDLRGQLVENGRYPADSDLVRTLDYLKSQGAEGQPPPVRDAVYESVGYACLRSDWRMDGMASAEDAPVCVHIKCGFAAPIHKHADDGSFQLYGLGQELIVDPAKFANDRTLPEALGADAYASHNVFRIVERNGSACDDLPVDPRLADWHLGDDSWILCRRSGEGAQLGRLFVYRRPGDLLVVDLIKSRHRLVGQSQMLLHPALERIENVTGGTGFRALRADGRGIEVRALPVRGLGDEGGRDGGLAFTRSVFHPAPRKRDLAPMALIRSTARPGRNALATHIRIEDGRSPVPQGPAVELRDDVLSVTFDGAEPIRVPWPRF